jgi:hypothetical protein
MQAQNDRQVCQNNQYNNLFDVFFFNLNFKILNFSFQHGLWRSQ